MTCRHLQYSIAYDLAEPRTDLVVNLFIEVYKLIKTSNSSQLSKARTGLGWRYAA